MTLIQALGLLGLLSILVLILIYVIKPNYQQTYVSSTFVWKLSLKYRKRRRSVNKLRNILLIAIQVLILTMASFILAQPGTVDKSTLSDNEVIAVIDTSASMRSEHDGVSRFERAVDRVQTLANDTFARNGVVTVIMADREADYLVQRASAADKATVDEALAELKENAYDRCSYGDADIDGAMDLVKDVLDSNPTAEAILYTGTRYRVERKSVRVENVAVEGEWNGAILNAVAALDENYYTISVDVACYGADRAVDLYCDVKNVNGTEQTVRLPAVSVDCYGEQTFHVVYSAKAIAPSADTVSVLLDEADRITSFGEVFVHIDERDSLLYDNEFYVYGGTKPTVKIQYHSSGNPYFRGGLQSVSAGLRDKLDITVKDVLYGEPELSGYDIYIFEHKMPDHLPTDGIVFMADPDHGSNAGFTIESKVNVSKGEDGLGSALAIGEEHPILNFIDPSSTRLTEYSRINYSSLYNFKTLMFFEGNPVFLLRDDPDSKIVVMAYSVHLSEIAISYYFPTLLYNFVSYFIPQTFSDEVYNVYDTVALSSRAGELNMLTPSGDRKTFTEFPASVTVDVPGTYSFSQTLLGNTALTPKVQNEKFYVRIDPAQSNIARIEDYFDEPIAEKREETHFYDFLPWLALVLVLLVLLEWELHIFDGN